MKISHVWNLTTVKFPLLMLLLALLGAGCGDNSWDKVSAGTPQNLTAVWGSGPQDVWAVGRFGTIVHWDGSTWSESPSGVSVNLHALWGSGPKDIWVVGDGGTALHFDGTAWKKQLMTPANDLEDVWGSGPSDVWIVQANNEKTLYSVLHWNGTAWSQVPLGVDALPEHIAGSGPTDVWLTQNALDGQKLLHWNGTKWAQVDLQISGVFLYDDILVNGPKDIWLVGRDLPNSEGIFLHFDGALWKPESSVEVKLLSPQGAWARSASDIWVVGAWGKVLHYDGTRWTAVRGEGILGADTDIYNSVWGSSDGDLWAVGDHGAVLYHR